MSLVLNDEQELIQQAAADFLKENAPVTHLRERCATPKTR